MFWFTFCLCALTPRATSDTTYAEMRCAHMRGLPCGTLLVLSKSRSLVAGVGGSLACRIVCKKCKCKERTEK